MVYPVLSPLVVRKNATVISAGPIGGGGLDVYGALHCGRIYTVFLPMPSKSWTLQYCPQGDHGDTTVKESSRTTTIRLSDPLVPPDPESRFDFKRLQVPREKLGKVIVLKGTLREDGVVDGLEVYRGVLPEMDEAARIAFSRWKFKPAMRGGKPVALEILVGISPEVATSSAP
jgi:hypothetical protein